MKIGFLTPEFPHPKTGSSGGIGTSILNLSKGLVAMNHQVILFIYGQDNDESFEENGIIFYKIKNIKLKGFSRILTQKKIEKLVNLLHAKNKIDLIEASDWTGITSHINFKCPTIIKLHGSDAYFCHIEQRPVKFWNKYFEKKALQKADGFLSVSKYAAITTNEVFGLDKDFTIIPNCIDLKLFEVEEKKSQQPLSILYFGTLIRKKGMLELPLIFNEVFKRNNQAKLILIGKDASDIKTGNLSTWELMQTLFHKEALQNVSYLGSIPYQEIREKIALATVCVFPTFAEALPVSWIEAMAMQKAIVASNIGWAKEIIEDEINGFLEHPSNHNSFADKIIKLLENEELRNQLGKAAKLKIKQNFSIEVVAKKSVEFYSTIIR